MAENMECNKCGYYGKKPLISIISEVHQCPECKSYLWENIPWKDSKIKLNLGSGERKIPGFINVDMNVDGADIKHDLNKYPYPFKENSIDFIRASHILEHLKEPMDFFVEIHRILKSGAKARIIIPHCNADGGAYGAMDHRNHFHESAIETITGVQSSIFTKNPYLLIGTKIKRGRFMKWKKREITWIIQK